MRLRGLTDTEGRLVVIALVGGTLMLAAAAGNMALARAADETAQDVRSILQRDAAAVSDDALADYPGTADAIEEMAVEALAGEPAQVLVGPRRAQRDRRRPPVGGAGRCGASSRAAGDATVLTYVRSQPC